MDVTTEYSSPVSLAVFLPAADPTAWKVVNVTTFGRDPYAPPVPTAAHLLPMAMGPSPGVTQYTRWISLPEGLIIPGGILYAFAADATGAVVASPGSVLWTWIIKTGVKSVTFSVSV
jgi:hypothetical protein